MRGIVYSLILLAFLASLLLFALTFGEFSSEGRKQSVVALRGRELVSFTESVQSDFKRVLDIVSRKALISADEYVVSNGSGLDNAQLRLIELMENKSIYGQFYLFMNTDSLTDWAGRINAGGNSRGFHTNVSVYSVNVTPFDSFTLNFSASIRVELREKSGLMNLSKNFSENVLVKITGLDDPLYPLNTNGFVERTIVAHAKGVWGVSRLDESVSSKWYFPSENGASFLDRLEGKASVSQKYAGLSSNLIGLESFVNVQEISSKGIAVKSNQSVIDFNYFNSSQILGFLVNGSLFSWLRLDNETAGRYGVGNQLVG